jgi:hypothetical protein
LCINQSDILERNDQVRQMQDVYQGAKSVHIWLGPQHPDTGPAVFPVMID